MARITYHSFATKMESLESERANKVEDRKDELRALVNANLETFIATVDRQRWPGTDSEWLTMTTRQIAASFANYLHGKVCVGDEG